jgi:hypothetical protein
MRLIYLSVFNAIAQNHFELCAIKPTIQQYILAYNLRKYILILIIQ